MRITVTGIDEFAKKYKRKFSYDLLDKAMHHVMIQVRNMAKNFYCPVDTGMLRDSIYIRRMAKAKYEFGFTVYYGVWHEWGSYNINTGTPENPNIIKSGYSPFMRPAIYRGVKMFPKILKGYFID